MLEAIKQAAREAGKIMLDSPPDRGADRGEGRPRQLRHRLRRRGAEVFGGASAGDPAEAGFLGEEGDGSQKVGEGYTFIVDPNRRDDQLYRRLPDERRLDRPRQRRRGGAGGRLQPLPEEMYWAEKGKGAFLNGKPLKICDGGLKDGVVCFGTAPYNPEYWDRPSKRCGRCCPGPSTSGGRGARHWTSAMSRPGGTSSFSSASSARGTTPPPSAILEEAGGVLCTMEGGEDRL